MMAELNFRNFRTWDCPFKGKIPDLLKPNRKICHLKRRKRMQRWNGWGDDLLHTELPPAAYELLQEFIGRGNPIKDYPLEKFLRQIPRTRLHDHPLISGDAKERLTHAHGQSLPDWIDMRMGTMGQFPDGVAFPANMNQLGEILNFSKKHKTMLIPFGGGTSVVGHLQVPESDNPVITLSLRRLRRLIKLDPHNRLATFEAGIMGPELESLLRAEGFTLGHYPQSFEYSSLGGWVTTRSSGQQSSHYGRIEKLFAGGEVLTPRGSLHIPPFPASAAGPDLRHMLMGSEGRMGVLSKAVVRISPIPEKDDVYGIFFPSWEAAEAAVREIAGTGPHFSMIRLSNPLETATNLALAGHEKQIGLLRRYLRMRNIQDKDSCMGLIGFIGSRRLVRIFRGEAFSIIRKHKGVSVGKIMGKAWKKNRFRAPYLRNTLWDMGYAVDTLETALNWDKVSPAMQSVEKAIRTGLHSRNEKVHVFSHLSHVYPTGSSIYTTYVFRLADTPEETLARWKTIKQAASHAIVESGGTISHQHGVGKDHAPYLEAEKGALGMDSLQQFFSFFDPEGRMNPGKMFEVRNGK